MAEFVPPDFDVPLGLETPQFVPEPLGPEHCERDYAALDVVDGPYPLDPRLAESRWPREMTLDENRADLERHANDFRCRAGFSRRTGRSTASSTRRARSPSTWRPRFACSSCGGGRQSG